MRLEVVGVPRRPPWPLWAVGLVLAWAMLGGAATWLAHSHGEAVTLCLFKRFTGVPCATCGFTRGMFALARGRFIQAWLFNPFLFSVLAVFAAIVVLRVIGGRAVRIQMTRIQRAAVWTAAATLFLANWAYVILYVG